MCQMQTRIQSTNTKFLRLIVWVLIGKLDPLQYWILINIIPLHIHTRRVPCLTPRYIKFIGQCHISFKLSYSKCQKLLLGPFKHVKNVRFHLQSLYSLKFHKPAVTAHGVLQEPALRDTRPRGHEARTLYTRNRLAY